jgi:hypothetical protein
MSTMCARTSVCTELMDPQGRLQIRVLRPARGELRLVLNVAEVARSVAAHTGVQQTGCCLCGSPRHDPEASAPRRGAGAGPPQLLRRPAGSIRARSRPRTHRAGNGGPVSASSAMRPAPHGQSESGPLNHKFVPDASEALVRGGLLLAPASQRSTHIGTFQPAERRRFRSTTPQAFAYVAARSASSRVIA